ncbi:hypothetical protein GCM10022224_061100 [Nonomuraea antimicrobica]|uniref:Uncharacterized protein n=1 Tax=Nonomuraea antimicrobica TaxID=561173 RepID=A0ABP7CH85_9ACTN
MTPIIQDAPGSFRHHDDGTFRKSLPAAQAQAEARGHAAVCGHLPAAALLGTTVDPDGRHTLIYQDVFADGRCTALLADLITRADADPRQTPAVTSLIDAACDSILLAAERTGQPAPIGSCRPGLYAERLRPGGRLDRWYAAEPPLTVVTGETTVDIAYPRLFTRLREQLATVTATALTQGDPTEPNIAAPLCWLDYQHAGRNALAGEAANLLWYLLAMGGWLVPRYKPLTYWRTVRAPGPARPPVLTHLHTGQGRLEVSGTLQVGAGRHAAIGALTRRLHSDLGALIMAADDPLIALRPWLVLRILGVLPLTAMAQADRAFCLGLLAQVLCERTRLEDLARVEPSPAAVDGRQPARSEGRS